MKLTDFVCTLFTDQNDPAKLTVALTMSVQALKKGHSATIIFLVDAVHLGHQDCQLTADVGMPFLPTHQLMDEFIALGGQIAVCKSCIEHNNIALEEINSDYVIITANDVIDLLMNAKGSLQTS